VVEPVVLLPLELAVPVVDPLPPVLEAPVLPPFDELPVVPVVVAPLDPEEAPDEPLAQAPVSPMSIASVLRTAISLRM
jgi:hypothetical protein